MVSPADEGQKDLMSKIKEIYFEDENIKTNAKVGALLN